MAHYDCSCCGESYGISHAYCDECKAGRCHRSQSKEQDMGLLDPHNQTAAAQFRALAATRNRPPAIPLSQNRKVMITSDATDDPVLAAKMRANDRDSLPAVLPPYDYEVKSWPQFFEPMVAGKKMHDMRNKKDRSYKVHDRMLLREFDPFGGGYTGRCAVAMITYITSNDTPCALSSVGLGDDMAILSVRVSGVYPDDDRNA